MCGVARYLSGVIVALFAGSESAPRLLHVSLSCSIILRRTLASLAWQPRPNIDCMWLAKCVPYYVGFEYHLFNALQGA